MNQGYHILYITLDIGEKTKYHVLITSQGEKKESLPKMERSLSRFDLQSNQQRQGSPLSASSHGNFKVAIGGQGGGQLGLWA